MLLTLSRDAYYEHTKALISLARSRDYLLFDELNSFLPPSASSPEDLDLVMALLGRLGIGVGETPEAALAAKALLEPIYQPAPVVAKSSKDDADVDLDSSDSDKYNDPVRMYLKEMGTVPLLKREDEVEIAKRIEIGVRSVMRELSRSRLAVGLLIDIGKMLKENPGKIREVVGLSDEVDDDEDAENTSATQHVHHQFEKLLAYDESLQELVNLKKLVDAGEKTLPKRRKIEREILRARGRVARQVRKLGLNSLAVTRLIDKITAQHAQVMAGERKLRELKDRLKNPAFAKLKERYKQEFEHIERTLVEFFAKYETDNTQFHKDFTTL